MPSNLKPFKPKALLFDVFGTCVDWRSTVTTALQVHASEALSSATSSLPSSLRLQASTTDWSAFAQRWRSSYGEFTQNYSPASTPFKTIDQHHHDSLVELMEEHGIGGLWSPEEVKEISLVWHHLDPWPDSAAGLAALNAQNLLTCTLTNGNEALVSDLVAHAKLPFARLFSAEMFGAYKPNQAVYLGAVEKLALEPGECAMVAAHLLDLKAASELGLRTVYVEREQEESWDEERLRQEGAWNSVDIWVGLGDGRTGKGGFLEAARRIEEKMGAG